MDERRLQLVAHREFFQTVTRHRPWFTDQTFLQQLLRTHAETAFGRTHQFLTIDSFDDFRSRVPVMGDSDLRTAVERIAAGETGVLTADPVIFLGLTSGTTGPMSMVPVTARSLEDRRRCLSFPAVTALSHFRGVAHRDILNLGDNASMPRGQTSGGIPYGSIASLFARRSPRRRPPRQRIWQPNQWVYGLPFQSENLAERCYAILRQAIHRDLRLITSVNASTLLVLATALREQGPQLIDEIRHGAFRSVPGIDDRSMTSLRRRYPANPRRADELEARQADGGLRPGDVWPNLRGLMCWTGGNAKPQAEMARDLYGVERIQELGIMATESLIAVPIPGLWSTSVPCCGSTFLEFIPQTERRAAPHDPYPATRRVHELDVGERYEVLVTAANGLYRFEMGDVVEVHGYCDQLPELRFVSKTEGVLSTTGEKLTELQAVDALTQAARSLNLKPRLVAVAGGDPSLGGHELAFELETPLTDEQADQLLAAAERELRVQNLEYVFHRDRGALGPPSLALIRPGAMREWSQRRLEQGAELERVKHPVLFSSAASLRETYPVDRTRAGKFWFAEPPAELNS